MILIIIIHKHFLRKIRLINVSIKKMNKKEQLKILHKNIILLAT